MLLPGIVAALNTHFASSTLYEELDETQVRNGSRRRDVLSRIKRLFLICVYRVLEFVKKMIAFLRVDSLRTWPWIHCTQYNSALNKRHECLWSIVFKSVRNLICAKFPQLWEQPSILQDRFTRHPLIPAYNHVRFQTKVVIRLSLFFFFFFYSAERCRLVKC